MAIPTLVISAIAGGFSGLCSGGVVAIGRAIFRKEPTAPLFANRFQFLIAASACAILAGVVSALVASYLLSLNPIFLPLAWLVWPAGGLGATIGGSVAAAVFAAFDCPNAPSSSRK